MTAYWNRQKHRNNYFLMFISISLGLLICNIIIIHLNLTDKETTRKATLKHVEKRIDAFHNNAYIVVQKSILNETQKIQLDDAKADEAGSEIKNPKNVKQRQKLDKHFKEDESRKQRCIRETESNITKYFKSLHDKLAQIYTPVVMSPSNACQNAGHSSYVAILIPCMESQYLQRQTVRDTWASIRNFGNRILSNGSEVRVDVSLIFVVASNNISSPKTQSIREENNSHDDILLLDMEESHTNLVFKVLAGLRWVTEHCRGSQYLLKVDIDVYVHLPNLIPVLLQMQGENVITGNQQIRRPVLRNGAWMATIEQYKFCHYLNFAEGNSYVISAPLIPKLLNASQYIPLLHNEDVYITGVLRSVVDAKLEDNAKFSYSIPRRPSMEKFFKDELISETEIHIEAMKELWSFYSKQI